IIDAAATVPFGPGNKMVLIEECALFTKKRGGKDEDAASAKAKPDKLFDDLDKALAAIQPNTHLILACIANFDSTLKVSKIFAKHAEIKKFEKIKYYAGAKNGDLISFCQQEAHRCGAFIEDEAAFYLAESSQVESGRVELRQIAGDIQKAAIYILPEKTIKLDHVIAVSPHFSDVFALMESWATDRKHEVLVSIKELQSRQVSPHMVMAAAQTVLSKWIMYKAEVERVCAAPAGGRDVRRREVPLMQIAQKLAPAPNMVFMIEKDLQRIRSRSLEYLSGKKRELTNLEYLLKSGQMPEG